MWTLKSGELGLVFDDAVKAPFFALIGVGCLFADMLPKTLNINDIVYSFVIRMVGVVNFSLSAWYWIASATNKQTSDYLLALAPIVALIVFAFVLMPFVMTILSFLLRKKVDDDS